MDGTGGQKLLNVLDQYLDCKKGVIKMTLEKRLQREFERIHEKLNKDETELTEMLYDVRAILKPEVLLSQNCEVIIAMTVKLVIKTINYRESLASFHDIRKFLEAESKNEDTSV